MLQMEEPSRGRDPSRALLMATFNNRASDSISPICLPSQSVSAWMTDLLSITTTTTTTTAVHPPLSYPSSLAFSSFFFAWCGNECAFDGFLSTCYIIRNRFYSLVLTISNAYCILLLVLPAFSLSISLSFALELPAWPTEFASSFGWGRSWSVGSLESSTLTMVMWLGALAVQFFFLPALPYPTLPYSHTLPSSLCSSEISGNRKESHCEIADITRVTSELSIPFT